MRILIRTSRWAIWARRLGSVAVPLVIISIALHRLRMITSDVFLSAAGAAAIVALLAVVVSVVALAHLWQSGDRGWDKAFAGLLFGLVCLAPFVWYGTLALQYPAATDIATTNRGLLPLVFEPGTAAMPPPRLLSQPQLAAIFPNVETRTYPVGQAQTFALVEQIIADNGWDVRMVRAPDETAEPALVNAQVMTLPGWREEIVVRVTGDAGTATVDMRSASLNALHDFGANGQRVEQFLADLDTAVTTLLRDNPNLNQPDTEPVAPVPAPPAS